MARLATALDEVLAISKGHAAVHFDVTLEQDWIKAIAQIEGDFGRLDILFLCYAREAREVYSEVRN